MPISDIDWIDSHCHLNAVDHWRVCQAQAYDKGIGHHIVPATQISDWQEVASMRSERVSVAIGVHPWFVREPQAEEVALQHAIDRYLPSAVGEIGLDFYRGGDPRPSFDNQIESFTRQLDLARHHGLPVIIHCVRAHNETIDILRKRPNLRGVIHAFSGSYELAMRYIELGFCLGAGPLVFRSPKTLSAFTRLPMDRIVLETDAPFMVKKHSDHVENPLFDLLKVAEEVAGARSISLNALKKQSFENTLQLFGIAR